MSNWDTLLQRPAALAESDDLVGWFTPIAARLLNGCRLLVAGEPHRFVEVEFYYHGPGHPDPFTHKEPLQRERGRWYFHRTRGVYRGGSFKGFDLTFGDGRAFGGVLIRGLDSPDGRLIDGPSKSVDHLLARTGTGDVASLDRAIAGRVAWDSDNPLALQDLTAEEERQTFRSARVGLSLRRARPSSPAAPEMVRYIMRPYRYLSEPRRVSKGKPYLVLALYAQGASPDDLPRLTGCPAKSVQRYIADFEVGRQEADFTPFFGTDLGPRDLCRLHGTWFERMGGQA
jgi:hypothetical protein